MCASSSYVYKINGLCWFCICCHGTRRLPSTYYKEELSLNSLREQLIPYNISYIELAR